jgi:hypothetical protein
MGDGKNGGKLNRSYEDDMKVSNRCYIIRANMSLYSNVK